MRKHENALAGLSERERQVVRAIRESPVPAVPQSEIEAVCRAAASYYTRAQGFWHADFWKVVFACLTIGSAFFWIVSAFLLGSCAALSLWMNSMEAEPLAVMAAIAPVPVLTFAIRELHYRDDRLVQLEKTCKYAPAKIYFARLWVGMLFNALFVACANAIAFASYDDLLRRYLFAFTAMFFVGAAALLVMSFAQTVLPLSLLAAIWVFGAVELVGQCEILAAIMDAGLCAFLAALAGSVGCFAAAAARCTRRLYA